MNTTKSIDELRADLNLATRSYKAAESAGDAIGVCLLSAWHHDIARRYDRALNAPSYVCIGNGLFVQVARR